MAIYKIVSKIKAENKKQISNEFKKIVFDT